MLPLISHRTPDATVAYRAGRPIRADEFVSDVISVAALLPRGSAVLNACVDRYRFAVGLAAAMLAGVRSLLPSTHTPQVIAQLSRDSAVRCLTDEQACAIALPRIHYPTSGALRTHWPPPLLPPECLVADVFTSGSTGTPVAHRKHFEPLVRSVCMEARAFGWQAGPAPVLLATVPPQHMYGLETSVLLPLQTGASFAAERPLLPADMVGLLRALPSPRALVTTPAHLHALLETDTDLPPLINVISATAPLPVDVAEQVERRYDTILHEIYGSTESGQIAHRRPTRTQAWQLFDGVELALREGRTWVSGGHVEAPVPLGDQIECLPDRTFLLGNRHEDMVNIAGKRSSIAYLNRQLLAIPGVIDGAFFLPPDAATSRTGVQRLRAVAVAPGLDVQDVLRALRTSIDPVFLPRPLRLVDSLPRNATGKVPLQALQALTEVP